MEHLLLYVVEIKKKNLYRLHYFEISEPKADLVWFKSASEAISWAGMLPTAALQPRNTRWSRPGTWLCPKPLQHNERTCPKTTMEAALGYIMNGEPSPGRSTSPYNAWSSTPHRTRVPCPNSCTPVSERFNIALRRGLLGTLLEALAKGNMECYGAKDSPKSNIYHTWPSNCVGVNEI